MAGTFYGLDERVEFDKVGSKEPGEIRVEADRNERGFLVGTHGMVEISLSIGGPGQSNLFQVDYYRIETVGSAVFADNVVAVVAVVR